MDFLTTVRECLAGPAPALATTQAPLPMLTRGQMQLQRVKQEAAHLRMKRDVQFAQIRTLLAQIPRTDARIVTKVRALQRIDTQLASYELQENQLEDALHQESMATIANETMTVLKKHAKTKKNRNLDYEINLADDMHADRTEMQEHLEALMTLDTAESDTTIDAYLATICSNLEAPGAIPDVGKELPDVARADPATEPLVHNSIEVPAPPDSLVAVAQPQSSPAARTNALAAIV